MIVLPDYLTVSPNPEINSGSLAIFAAGGDINEAVVALRMVLQLERVPCPPQ